MTSITLLLKELKIQWAILKNEEAPKVDRRESCKKIVEIENKIKEIDPTFNTVDLNSTQYAEFVPSEIRATTSVNWGEVDDSFGKEEQATLEKWTAVAVRIAKKRLPRESVETQKFGMVVNAITTHLLQITHSK